MGWLAILGSIASIVGLCISVWVLLRLRAIERNYLFRARVPELQRRLRRHCSNVAGFLASYPDSADAVRVELSRCRATLKSLTPKLERRLRAELRNIQAEIDGLREVLPRAPEEQLWEIHSSLAGLEQELKYIVKDMEWRAPR